MLPLGATMIRIDPIVRLYRTHSPEVIAILKRRPAITYAISGAMLLAALWLFAAPRTNVATDVVVTPVRGQFLVTVTTSGELQAKHSINILGPENARAANIWQMKLTNIIPEGTVVRKGEFVGELDKSEISGKFKDSQLSLQKLESQYLQTKLDSALALSQARDELVNLSYTEEEKRLAMEQSTYEAPALRRQAEIEYERSQRSLQQAKKNYITKTQQAIAKTRAAEADLMKERRQMEVYQKTLLEFTIKAPADGMVIYAREWNGTKKIVGSTISAWDPIVATLPDLREMESITYISELDIQKIAAGQPVKLKLDADPNKVLTGSVTSVANIGEQRPNSDSKVFEVHIKVNEADTTLRPAMTTSNDILVAKIDSALSIPLECVHTEGSMTFVYKKTGRSIVKQEVKLGMINDNASVVLNGVEEKDELLLTVPAEPGNLKSVPLAATN
jgi:multidrug efflux pump subunit AcrA (membrane-fusion protein)